MLLILGALLSLVKAGELKGKLLLDTVKHFSHSTIDKNYKGW
jgi:hypothetical protein